MSAPQVGDVISTAEELDQLPMDAVVMDADGDAWQWQQGLWMCTDRDASPDALSAYVPFTVIYLPGQPPRPERVVKAEALREAAESSLFYNGDSDRALPGYYLLVGRAERIEAGESS